jgi:ligand-binding SRPBCC domain-containing protein
MPHFTFNQWIPASLEKVFLFFADPANLPRVMPAWMDVRIERERILPPPAAELVRAESVQPPAPPNRLAGVGSEIEASYRTIPGIPFRIGSVAVITAFSMYHFFEDVQGRGPFKTWHHRHEFHTETREGVPGTIIRDIVDYEIGLGMFGRVGNALFVAPQMSRTFRYRQQTIARLLAL